MCIAFIHLSLHGNMMKILITLTIFTYILQKKKELEKRIKKKEEGIKWLSNSVFGMRWSISGYLLIESFVFIHHTNRYLLGKKKEKEKQHESTFFSREREKKRNYDKRKE